MLRGHAPNLYLFISQNGYTQFFVVVIVTQKIISIHLVKYLFLDYLFLKLVSLFLFFKMNKYFGFKVLLAGKFNNYLLFKKKIYFQQNRPFFLVL